jgi:3-oxoacyl-[acyl-carrier-protein] synthase-3
MPSSTPSPRADAAARPAAVLCGLGGALPARVVTNAELAGRLDTSDAWITSRTGIRQRHVATAGTATSDLAVEAGARALKSSGSAEADAVVLATTTPDRPCPATAPEVAARLGLTGVAAFDVGGVCTGFLYALASGVGLVCAGLAERVLVVGADTFSTILNPADRSTAVVFGDGAGGVVLRAGHPDEPGALGAFDLGSDGGSAELIQVAAGGSRQRTSGRRPAPEDFFFSMDGRAVFRQAVERMAGSVRTVLDRTGWRTDEVDHVVSHQANQRILDALARELGIGPERCVSNIARVGNTAAASIPLALVDAVADGSLRPDQRVLLTAFGGGLTWGATALVWPELPALPDTSIQAREART